MLKSDFARPFWVSNERWHAWGMFALLIVLLLGQTAFSVLFNRESGEFTSALAAGDSERFWTSIRLYTTILVAAVPIYALYYYVLGLRWRRWLTDSFLQRYFRQRAYYRLNTSGIDNPDQRIAEDISSFTQRSLYFSMIALGSLIDLAAFSAVLWTISCSLVLFLLCAGHYEQLGDPANAPTFQRQKNRISDLGQTAGTVCLHGRALALLLVGVVSR